MAIPTHCNVSLVSTNGSTMVTSIIMNYVKQNIIVIAATVALLASSGCKKDTEYTEFNIPFETTFTYPADTSASVDVSFNSGNLPTNISQRLSSAGSNTDGVQDIKMISATLDLINPAGGDFDFLDSVSVHLGGPGLPELKAAWKEPVALGSGAQLQLEPWTVDFQNYVKQSDIRFRTRLLTDQATTVNHEMKLIVTFRVNTEVL